MALTSRLSTQGLLHGRPKTYIAGALFGVFLCLLFALACQADEGTGDQVFTFNVTERDGAAALNQFASQTGVVLLYPYMQVRDKTVNPVIGRYPMMEALQLLLKGSGLSSGLTDKGAIKITIDRENQVKDREKTEMNNEKAFGKKLAAALVSFWGVSYAAYAQVEQREVARGIEEVIVTAQRREQNLQSVPIAITAMDSESLASAGIQSTQDLGVVVPGLQVTMVGSSLTPYLRGVGTQNASPGMEPSIATYVDGIYYSSVGANVFALNNIQRIEVLKGPQGTLFGRNATGGLIHVITRDPSFEPSGELRIGYGNYNTISGSFYGTTGLSDTVAADIAVNYADQDKGWGKNLTTGQDVNLSKETSIRSRIRWEPIDRFDATLTLDHNVRDSDIGWISNAYPGSILIDGESLLGSIYDSRGNAETNAENEQWGVALVANLEFEVGILTSSSAYRKYDLFNMFDFDRTPIPSFKVFGFNDMETIQQEFLFNGQLGDFDFTTGFFYYWSEAGWGPLGFESAAAAANTQLFSSQETDSYSVFAQGAYSLTDNTAITLGLRQTYDERDISGYRVAVDPHPASGAILQSTSTLSKSQTSKDYSKLTWRLSLEHQFAQDIFGYVSASRGFKSGIFNGGNPFERAVEPETLDAYSIGLKTEFYDNRIRFNAEAFYYEYDKIQLNLLREAVTSLLNASSAEVRGVDLEVEWAPEVRAGFFRLNIAATFLDTEYGEFVGAPGFIPYPNTEIPNGYFNCSPVPATGGNRQCSVDATGNSLMRAPDFTISTSLAYEYPIMIGTLGFNIAWYYNDGFYWEPENRLRQPSYNLLNAQLSFSPVHEKWDVRLHGSNLTDEKYYTQLSSSVQQDAGGPGAPRTYGITFRYHLGN